MTMGVSLVVISLLAVEAYADVIRPLMSEPGVAEVRGACARAGGQLTVRADGGG